MYLKSDKYKPKYPKYWELAGGWEAAVCDVSFSAGIFVPMPEQKGYTFFCQSLGLNGFRDKKEWKTGDLMFLEINRTTFKSQQKIGENWVDVDTEPQKIELAICDYLDSEKGQKYVTKPWKGKFTINASEAFCDLIPSMGLEVLLKNMEELPPSEKEKILPQVGAGQSKGGYGSKGYSGMPPKDLAQSRLAFIKETYKEAYNLEDSPSVEAICTLMAGSQADNSFQKHLQLLIELCLANSK